MSSLGIEYCLKIINILQTYRFKVKVLYIHQYFKTPSEGGSIRSYHLTKELVKKGLDVEVITAHDGIGYERKDIEGVIVHYLPVYYRNELSYKKRVFAFLKFTFLAIRKSMKIKGVDVCYVMTTPLTTGLIALWNKLFLRRSYIFEVGDLWPSVPVDMGVIKNPIFKKLMFSFEKYFYQNSVGIVALSSGIADYVKIIVPNKPIEIITNVSDTDFFHLEEKKESLKKQFGIKNEFVITYSGTLGSANHLEYLLEAAQACAGLNVKFLILGKGAEADKLKRIQKEKSLTNLTFLPHADKEVVREVLNVSDAVYISFNDIESLHTGSPNKLFDGLAAGKLIIINFGGWIKTLLQTNDAGFSYNPNNTKAFTEKLLLFITNKEILKSFQKNSRQLAENSFSIEMLSERQGVFIQSSLRKG
ncbi:MAG: glycosyltransferase involved in cell wall biosynthesis [Cyclobacteriaceae bacterium]